MAGRSGDAGRGVPGAGRSNEAIAWLEEQRPRIRGCCRRWPISTSASGAGRKRLPPTRAQLQRRRAIAELKVRYASALINAGGRDNLTKARDVAQGDRRRGRAPPISRALYCCRRRSAGSATPRRPKRPRAASSRRTPRAVGLLRARRSARGAPRVPGGGRRARAGGGRETAARADGSFDVGMLLPHLGFAYQELGQSDKAIAAFEDARRLSPDDPAVAGYLVEAQHRREEIQSRRRGGEGGADRSPGRCAADSATGAGASPQRQGRQGIALLEEAVKKHGDDPAAYIALAQMYADADRGAQAVKVLQDAQAKFPTDDAITFELGATFDKQNEICGSRVYIQAAARARSGERHRTELPWLHARRARRASRRIGGLSEEGAADRAGERRRTSTASGWAYYKADKLDLAETTSNAPPISSGRIRSSRNITARCC